MERSPFVLGWGRSGIVAFAALALVLTACGSGGSGGEPVACVPTSEDDECWQQVIAAAEDEGVLKLGVSTGPGMEAFVADAQEAMAPHFDIEYEALPGGAFVTKVLSEQSAGQFLWDVHTGPAVNKYSTLAPAGGLTDIREVFAGLPPENRQDEDWQGGFGSYDNHQTASFTNNIRVQKPTCVNRDHPDAASISEPEDLLDPALQGKIAMFEPKGSNLASQSLAWFMERPEYGQAYVEKLLAQGPVFGSAEQVAQWVAEGRYAVGLGVADDDLALLQENGLGKNVECMQEWGFAAAVNTASVMANAPHPNAARVFLNWFLSQEGQSTWASGASTNQADSRRKDVPVPNPKYATDYSKLDLYSPIFGTGQGEESLAKALELAAGVGR